MSGSIADESLTEPLEGLPGVGKTAVTCLWHDFLEREGAKVVLMATTNLAATNYRPRGAIAWHRGFGARPNEHGELTTTLNPLDPQGLQLTQATFAIVDEASMLSKRMLSLENFVLNRLPREHALHRLYTCNMNQLGTRKGITNHERTLTSYKQVRSSKVPMQTSGQNHNLFITRE